MGKTRYAKGAMKAVKRRVRTGGRTYRVSRYPGSSDLHVNTNVYGKSVKIKKGATQYHSKEFAFNLGIPKNIKMIPGKIKGLISKNPTTALVIGSGASVGSAYHSAYWGSRLAVRDSRRRRRR